MDDSKKLKKLEDAISKMMDYSEGDLSGKFIKVRVRDFFNPLLIEATKASRARERAKAKK